MATWFRPHLTSDEQTRVLADRDHHPDPVVRRKMNVLWAVHLGYSREEAAKLAGLGVATAKRYLIAFRDGGLDGLQRRKVRPRPTSELAAHADVIKQTLAEQPVRTAAEAAERIYQLTGIRRGLTQTRAFLASLGFTWQRSRAVPVPPKSHWPSTLKSNATVNIRSSCSICDIPDQRVLSLSPDSLAYRLRCD